VRLAFDLPANRRSPAAARAALVGLSRHVAPPVLENLCLVVTELVTNAIVHAPGQRIAVEVAVDDDDGVLRGVVRDPGTGVVAIREAVADDEGGYGLRLVDRLADRWGVHKGSTHVWFEMSFTRPEPESA